jgi:hypothetical protein
MRNGGVARTEPKPAVTQPVLIGVMEITGRGDRQSKIIMK